VDVEQPTSALGAVLYNFIGFKTHLAILLSIKEMQSTSSLGMDTGQGSSSQCERGGLPWELQSKQAINSSHEVW
jgi:hypothetical protein